MPKRDLGKDERDRLRNLPGDEGEVWRDVFGRNELEFLESLIWEEAQAQAQRPHALVAKYTGARRQAKRRPGASSFPKKKRH